MNPTIKAHRDTTEALAQSLSPGDVFNWLSEVGYFPESYVLPPCFYVSKHPSYGREFFPISPKFKPSVTEYQIVQFPKTELTDRTFGIIDPEIHSEIAKTIADNWSDLVAILFHPDNQIASYSFPIPITKKLPGNIGALRAGRMIYEFIEMAENDLASIAHRYKYIFKTDIKNFYPSIYTHSIPWAIHGKAFIRIPANRTNYSFFGNRLDKLFQNANDGCTNGLPIGPAVSDLISEIILSAVDIECSAHIDDDMVVVRFKDDYRILATSESKGRKAIRAIQAALKSFKLELNDDKTESNKLPDGLFRKWVSQYHSANPLPRRIYDFKRFKEIYLSVIQIDRDNRGCGVIDRFLADITKKDYSLRLQYDKRSLPKIVSLLLMLARLRVKAFPKVLALIESVIHDKYGRSLISDVMAHLEEFLFELSQNECDNRYLIAWIVYFVRSNNLESYFTKSYSFSDPVIKSVFTSKNNIFPHHPEFQIFTGVKTIARKVSLLSHLDVFKPQ